MSLRLLYAAVSGQFSEAMAQMRKPIAEAGTAAIKQAALEIKSKGRAQIAAGGFGPRWQNALRVEVYPKSGVSIDAALLAHHKIPYAGVFQRGAAIGGKPLLWLPIGNGPQKVGGQRLTPRVFQASIGPLIAMKAPGHPPMLGSYVSARTRKVTVAALRKGNTQRRTRRISGASESAGLRLVPVFVGIPRVQLKKRFNLQGVFDAARGGLGRSYLAHLKV